MHEQKKQYIKSRILEAGLYVVLGTLSAFPLVITILMGTLLEYTILNVFLMCVSFSVLTAVIFFNKKTLIAAGVLVSLAALFVYAQSFANDWYSTITYPLVQRIHRTILFSIGHLEYTSEYASVLVVGITFLVVLLAAISIYWSFNFYPLFFLGAAIFIISWSFGFPRNDYHVLTYLFAMTVLFIRKLNMASKERPKDFQPSNNKLVIISIPVCALILAAAFYMPKPDIEYNREGVANFFANPIGAVQEFVHFTFNPKYFALHTSGFGDSSGRLGGRVRLSRHEVMRVWADERIYLVGGIMDYYTGDRWLGSFDEFVPFDENEFMFRAEYAEALKAFLSPHTWGLPSIRDDEAYGFLLALPFEARRSDIYGLFYHQNLDVITENVIRVSEDRGVHYDMSTLMPVYISPDKVPAFIRNSAYRSYLSWVQAVEAVAPFQFDNEVTINIGRARTGSLFVANRADRNIAVEHQPDMEIIISGNNSIRATTPLLQNSQYSFTYTRIDYDNIFVQEVLNLASAGFYDYILENHYDLFSDELREIYEQWQVHALEIRANFTQLPETLPQRVIDLAFEITYELESDFQKAQAVETFLRQNFRYNLNVDSLPFGEDFVDYFLFEMYEGYCTYFASAMAILLRAVGIPTRYVVGYLLPHSRTADGYFLVTGEHAHAWVDVYLEGFGWLLFEPTPPQHYSRLGITPDLDIFAQDFLYDPWFDEHFDLWGFALDAARENEDTDDENNMQGGPLAANDQRPMNPVAVASFTVGSVLALIFAFKGLKMAFFYLDVKQMPLSDQAVAYFGKIQKVWAFDGYVKKSHETPANFVNRIPIYNYSVDRMQLVDSVGIYYKAQFSRDGITSHELASIKKTWKLVYADIIKRSNGFDKVTGYVKRLLKVW